MASDDLPELCPERTPMAVTHRHEMLARLMHDEPVVPTRANGGKPDWKPDADNDEETPAVPEVPEQDSYAPQPPVVDTEAVISGTRMTFNEMRDHVLSKMTPDELLGLSLSRIRSKDRVLLHEGRFVFPLEVLFFSASETQVVFYMDKKLSKDMKFEEGSRYRFEHNGTLYESVMFLGSVFPSTNFSYPLMSFLREPPTDDQTRSN